MPGTPLNHICVLVADLEAAVDQYQKLFGLTFHPPSTMRFNRICDAAERSVDVRATLSIEGPPHVEFIEAAEDGIFGIVHGLGIHHVGVLQSCIDRHCQHAVDELDVQSSAHVLTQAGDLYAWFSEPSTTLGVRFEFINQVARTALLSKLDPEPSPTTRDNFFEI